jgi:polyribonucleotide nucleotidyltransferase
VQIDIEEDGTLLIYATDGEKAEAAISAIRALTKVPEVGDTYTGKVVKTTEFGAFVELKKGTDGLLHVSNVGPGRVAHIEDVMTRGDIVDVIVQEVDKARGRIGLKLVAKHEDGTILIYATDGEKAAAGIAAIQALTKEPEVGDTYTGKVVKTTQFGAFVELKKGTDGLLHVSNVGPGRVGHIEDVMARGDVLDVVVQEVDKARGRIGLKLIAKHENGSLVQPEELIERAKDAPPRPPEEERPRRDDRSRGRGGGGRR